MGKQPSPGNWGSGGNKRVFVPCPDGGQRLVLVDIVDLGTVETTWKGKKKKQQKTRLVFESEHEYEHEWDGKKSMRRFIVSERFTASLFESSRLRAFLNSWRGKKLTDEEAEDFNPEVLIGRAAYAQIVHAEVGKDVFANIDAIMKMPKGMDALEPSGHYVRVRDRKVSDGPDMLEADDGPPPDSGPPVWPDEDDDLPF